MELKISQLSLVKIFQMGRLETVNPRSEHYSPKVESSIPTEGNFLLNLIYYNTVLAELAE